MQYNVTHDAAHHLCSFNRVGIEKSQQCGCFCCCQIFPAVEITNYVGAVPKALCPYCGIDAVLPDAWIELSRDLLVEMKKRWFRTP